MPDTIGGEVKWFFTYLSEISISADLALLSTRYVILTGPCFSVEQFSGSAVSILSWDYDVGITSAYLQRMLPGDTAVN